MPTAQYSSEVWSQNGGNHVSHVINTSEIGHSLTAGRLNYIRIKDPEYILISWGASWKLDSNMKIYAIEIEEPAELCHC